MSQLKYCLTAAILFSQLTACGGGSNDEDKNPDTGNTKDSPLIGEYSGFYYSFGIEDISGSPISGIYDLHSNSSLAVNSVDKEKALANTVLNQTQSYIQSIKTNFVEGEIELIADAYPYQSLYNDARYSLNIIDEQHLSANNGEEVVDSFENTQGIAQPNTEAFLFFSDNIISSSQWTINYYDTTANETTELQSQYTESSLTFYSKAPDQVTQEDLAGSWAMLNYASDYFSTTEASEAYVFNYIGGNIFDINNTGEITNSRFFECNYKQSLNDIEACSLSIGGPFFPQLTLKENGAIEWQSASDTTVLSGRVSAHKNIITYDTEDTWLPLQVKLNKSITFDDLSGLSFEYYGIGRTMSQAEHAQETLVSQLSFEVVDDTQVIKMQNAHFLKAAQEWPSGEDATAKEIQWSPEQQSDVTFKLNNFSEIGHFEASLRSTDNPNVKMELDGFIMSDGDSDGKPDGLIMTYKIREEESESSTVVSATAGIGMAGLIQ